MEVIKKAFLRIGIKEEDSEGRFPFFFFFTPHEKEEKFANINIKHHYNSRLSAKECFSVKFSRTEKIKKNLLLELLSVSIWKSITLSVKTLNGSSFRKKLNHYSLMF